MTARTDHKTDTAKALLEAYLERSGISGAGGDRNRRYLWTDAFAVRGCIGLAAELEEPEFKNGALRLVDAVHEVLGRHRPDDPEGREGWISGLPEKEGARHPTLGGLRIGKAKPERQAHELGDERLEWEQDGQYFHYLTRWIKTLLRTWRETEDRAYGVWAAELMEASRAFVIDRGPCLRMYWKMSIDRSRPLVASMGAHDPLDGLLCVDAIRKDLPDASAKLDQLELDFQALCDGKSWATPDPLGIGGLLLDLANLSIRTSGGHAVPPPLKLEKLVLDSFQSLAVFHETHRADCPADRRLAFRECGLSLGIRVLEACVRHGLLQNISEEKFAREIELADEIEDFWSDPAKQRARTWTEHEDINAVMLASSLLACRQPWAFAEQVPGNVSAD
ncbi:MAG TPA: hypothetical protein VJ952_07220 [Opitutales bacterium]|nr:hypothetical protein [Opitutales bacterium]